MRMDEPVGSGMPAQLINASMPPYWVRQVSIRSVAVRSLSGAPTKPTAVPPLDVIAPTVSSTTSA
ncbi:Uncharacterised protein [Mycobacteroides abscessus subsp. abscessus]|nr:Uncharacterised protein [Mycobacteroides abscessus subsp. abscessus]